MPPKVRDPLLVFCALAVVGLAVAMLLETRRMREFAQSTYDEARSIKVAGKHLDDQVEEIRKDVHPKEVERASGLSAFLYRCSSNGVQASCEFTNVGAKMATACWVGVVQRKGSSATAESLVTCTGDVHPKSTLSMTAEYQVGSIVKLCPGTYGGLNWDDCTFTIVDVTGKVPPKE